MKAVGSNAVRVAVMALVAAVFLLGEVRAQSDDIAGLKKRLDELRRVDKNAEAIALAERLLDQTLIHKGEDHPDTAIVSNELAFIYRATGRYTEAERLYKRVLEIRASTLPPGHRDIAKSLGELAFVYMRQGRPSEAESLYKRALEMREKVLPAGDADIAESLADLAFFNQDLGRYAEAESLYKRALEMRENMLPPSHPDIVQSLNSLAYFYFHTLQGQGRRADAEAHYKRALEIRERTLPAGHPDIARSLGDLAFFYKDSERMAEADLLYKRLEAHHKYAIENAEREYGPASMELAKRLVELASLYDSQLHQYAEADVLYQREVKIYEENLGEDSLEFAKRLEEIAERHNNTHLSGKNTWRFPDAEALLRRAVAAREKLQGPDHFDFGESLNRLAITLSRQERNTEAEQLYRRTLAINEKLFGAEDPKLITILSNLAYLLERQGPSKAQQLYKRALAIQEKAFGPDDPKVAALLLKLALAYAIEGRYADAELLYKRAVAIYEKLNASNSVELAKMIYDVIHKMTSIHHNLPKDHSYSVLTEQLLKRGLSILDSLPDPDRDGSPLQGYLSSLAELYYEQQRYVEAEPLFKRVIAVDERQYGPKGFTGPLAQSARLHLARIYTALDRKQEEAELLLKRKIADNQKLHGQDTAYIVVDLINLGELYDAQKRHAEAESIFKRALAIAEAANITAKGVYEETYLFWALRDIAYHYIALGRWNETLLYARRAREILLKKAKLNNTLIPVATTDSNPLRAIIWSAWAVGRQDPDRELRASFITEAFASAQWLGQPKAGLSLARMSARFAKGEGPLSELVRELQNLPTERQQVDKQLVDLLAAPDAKRDSARERLLEKRIVEIDTRLDEINARLRESFPDYFAVANPDPLSIKEVQELLDPDEILVQFTSVWANTFAFAVTRERSEWINVAERQNKIDSKVEALRCGLDERAWDDEKGRARCNELVGAAAAPNGSLPFHLGQAHDLYETLFGRLRNEMKGKRLIVVASGPLATLPFGVLVTEKPGEALPKTVVGYRNAKWLGTQTAITILPSVPSLRALRKFSKARSRAPEPFIGFGDPVLHGNASCGTPVIPTQCPSLGADRGVAALDAKRSMRRVTQLPVQRFFQGGLVNVEILRTQCPLPETSFELRCVAQSLGVPESQIQVREMATETAVKKAPLERYQIVHFATHGLLASDMKPIIGRLQSEPALLMTPPQTASELDDGLLTASEITQLKLNADWVVLSACNTAGPGDTSTGEALSGLARAFFYAGARALLVSNWAVDSDAAVLLTTRAFAELVHDPAIGRAEALRRSMQALLADKSRPAAAHPSFWAPFVVVGEGAR